MNLRYRDSIAVSCFWVKQQLHVSNFVSKVAQSINIIWYQSSIANLRCFFTYLRLAGLFLLDKNGFFQALNLKYPSALKYLIRLLGRKFGRF